MGRNQFPEQPVINSVCNYVGKFTGDTAGDSRAIGGSHWENAEERRAGKIAGQGRRGPTIFHPAEIDDCGVDESTR